MVALITPHTLYRLRTGSDANVSLMPQNPFLHYRIRVNCRITAQGDKGLNKSKIYLKFSDKVNTFVGFGDSNP